jgi:hypothetical protein
MIVEREREKQSSKGEGTTKEPKARRSSTKTNIHPKKNK